MRTLTALLIATAMQTSAIVAAQSEEQHSVEPSLSLSAGVIELFRAEMRELLSGTQVIATALPKGDWDEIVATSRKMKESYVLEKKITPAQEKELTALPEHFKNLDSAFHARLGKLADAAAHRDAELVAYHFSRVLETCVACHGAFAHARFPSLATSVASHHH